MDSPTPPRRFQFSLRTALLLSPLAAGLVYLNLTAEGLWIAWILTIDFVVVVGILSALSPPQD